MITTATVKPAWPAANEMAEGATPARRTATGSTAHSSSWWVPRATTTSEPTPKPTTVPTTARTAVAPVPSAFERSTDSVPSTTQNPCCTSVASTVATARARATAPRTLLRNHTERGVQLSAAACTWTRSDRQARRRGPALSAGATIPSTSSAAIPAAKASIRVG